MADFKGKDIFSYLKRLLKYTLSTLAGTVVDNVVLWIFATYIFHIYTLRYVVSPIISFECAAFVNFLLAYNVVWKNRISARTTRSFFRHFAAFNLSATSIFLLKLGLINVIAPLTHWHPVVCNIIALCITGFCNFAINEFVIFKVKSSNADTKAGIVEELELDTERGVEGLTASSAKSAAAKASASAEGGESSSASDRS